MKKILVTSLLCVSLAGWIFPAMAGDNKSVTASGTSFTQEGRGAAIAGIRRGETLFAKHCAQCHGAMAEGAPNWNKKGPDGKFPPPPLNGTAHAWHHSRAALARTIRDGTGKIGGNMPGFRDRLDDGDINAIIDWFSSLWPEELYQAWLRQQGH